MSTPKNERNRAAKRGALIHRAGNAPDAGAVAQATFEVWNQVAALFAPVIGTRGVDVLFSRSLHLTGSTFTELLSSLIGEPLTEQLLRPAWAVPPPVSIQETGS